MNQERPSINTFAETLKNCGMPPKQAEVYAHRAAFNHSNSETATQLNKTDSTISNQCTDALGYVQNARKITHYTHTPEYLTELSQATGEIVFENTPYPIHIRLHRPTYTESEEYEYTLTNSETIEAYQIPATDNTEFLFVYNYITYDETHQKRFFAIESKFVPRFLADWVLPNRHRKLRFGTEDTYPNQWFLTQLFEVEEIEKELKSGDITPVNVFTDERFQPPSAETVQLTSGGKTESTPMGYKPAYAPTDDELTKAVEQNRITQQTADEITFQTS